MSIVTDVLTLVLSTTSLGYAIWTDKFKYRAQPYIYVRPSSSDWELTILNHNSYSIQLRDIRAVKSRRRLKARSGQSIVADIRGRRDFPILLGAEDRAIVSVGKALIGSAEQLELVMSSGRVGVRGRPRETSVYVRLPH